MKKFNIHDWQAKINEQSFDDRLKAAGGFSDEEFDDITSIDVGTYDNKAKDLIEKLRED